MLSIGTDIVQISRIQAVLDRQGQRFVDRILTPFEREQYVLKHQSVTYLAKRFAAKEAISKALGTGIAQGLSFQHIEIRNNGAGAPTVSLFDMALKRLHDLKGQQVLISLSDEKDYVVAFAALTN